MFIHIKSAGNVRTLITDHNPWVYDAFTNENITELNSYRKGLVI